MRYLTMGVMRQLATISVSSRNIVSKISSGLLIFTLVTALVVSPVGAAPALLLPSDSFTHATTINDRWSSGISMFGSVEPCLTAGTGSTPGSIPGCDLAVPDPDGSGALRLTPTTPINQNGYALLDQAISATEGLDITFDMFQYGGITTGDGRTADGLAFFLVDGSVSPATVGPPGGPLGYASLGFIPGVDGAVLGVGFDAYGNFSRSAVGGGGPSSTDGDPDYAHSIVLRSGEATGYDYIQGHRAGLGHDLTGTPQELSNPTATTRSAAIAKTVRVSISPEGNLNVWVSYNGGPAILEIKDIDISTINGSTPLPSTLKLGFSASTGGATDIHEIQNLMVTAFVPTVVTPEPSPSPSSPVVPLAPNAGVGRSTTPLQPSIVGIGLVSAVLISSAVHTIRHHRTNRR